MQGKFFQQITDALTSAPLYTIQIPSPKDIAKMQAMMAGGDEDQSKRLQRMAHTIRAFAPSSAAIVSTEGVPLPNYWRRVFEAIHSGNQDLALQHLNAIPEHDKIFKALTSVHPINYLGTLVLNCVTAKKQGGTYQVNGDVIFTTGTFEVLIKDLAATFDCKSKLSFSFGLPTHHAYSEESSGFCFLNKTAILIKDAHLTYKQTPPKILIVGMDVNRDDGLNSILWGFDPDLDITHVDLFDSRVYPHHTENSISTRLGSPGYNYHSGKHANAKCWNNRSITYLAVDLSTVTRKYESIHPALLFALEQVNEAIRDAVREQQKLIIYLPTGWDSHAAETAACGKLINGHYLRDTEAYKCRFTNDDLNHFYDELFKLYKANAESIDGIFWNLEGGYNTLLNQEQIMLLLQSLNKAFPNETPAQANNDSSRPK